MLLFVRSPVVPSRLHLAVREARLRRLTGEPALSPSPDPAALIDPVANRALRRICRVLRLYANG
jgi:hypothetical protein